MIRLTWPSCCMALVVSWAALVSLDAPIPTSLESWSLTQKQRFVHGFPLTFATTFQYGDSPLGVRSVEPIGFELEWLILDVVVCILTLLLSVTATERFVRSAQENERMRLNIRTLLIATMAFGLVLGLARSNLRIHGILNRVVLTSAALLGLFAIPTVLEGCQRCANWLHRNGREADEDADSKDTSAGASRARD